MKIVTIPHPSLRTTAKPVERVDAKLLRFVKELGSTLQHTKNPKGVGLAATQVDKNWRIFSTNINRELRIFINPRIEKHSSQQILGDDPDEPLLEGCLSIPKFWGAVPRWEWVDLVFDTIAGDSLVTTSERFSQYPARVVQHEADHLDGILFIDYSLEYGLPVYQTSVDDPDSYKAVDRKVLEAI